MDFCLLKGALTNDTSYYITICSLAKPSAVSVRRRISWSSSQPTANKLKHAFLPFAVITAYHLFLEQEGVPTNVQASVLLLMD